MFCKTVNNKMTYKGTKHAQVVRSCHMATINLYSFPCYSEKTTIYHIMGIKRVGLKVANNVLFLNHMTTECPPKTPFPTVTLTQKTPVEVLQKLLY